MLPSLRRTALSVALVASSWGTEALAQDRPVLGSITDTIPTAARFSPGWYIVEPCAQFSVIQASAFDVAGAAEAAAADTAPAEVTIYAGEAVFAFERTRDAILVLEWFGRMSAVKPDGCLTRAPAGGRPGYLQTDVQLFDGQLRQGSALWIVGIDAGTGVATVQVTGGRRQNIPNATVTLIANLYGDLTRQAIYHPVR